MYFYTRKYVGGQAGYINLYALSIHSDRILYEPAVKAYIQCVFMRLTTHSNTPGTPAST